LHTVLATLYSSRLFVPAPLDPAALPTKPHALPAEHTPAVHVAAAVAFVNTAHGTRADAPASTLDTTPVSAYGDPHVVALSHPQLASVTGSGPTEGSGPAADTDARAELLAVGDDATPDAADALAAADGVVTAGTAGAADILAVGELGGGPLP
jgi:hypothetical protein